MSLTNMKSRTLDVGRGPPRAGSGDAGARHLCCCVGRTDRNDVGERTGETLAFVGVVDGDIDDVLQLL